MEISLNSLKETVDQLNTDMNSMFKEFLKELVYIKQEINTIKEIQQRIIGIEKQTELNSVSLDLLAKNLENYSNISFNTIIERLNNLVTEERFKEKINNIQLQIEQSRDYQSPALCQSIKSIEEKLEEIQSRNTPENDAIRRLTEQIAKIPVDGKKKVKTNEPLNFWTVKPEDKYL